MNKELKPCPFCGGEAKLYWGMNEYSLRRNYGVVCKSYGCCRMPAKHLTEELAIMAWNRRAADETYTDRCE